MEKLFFGFVAAVVFNTPAAADVSKSELGKMALGSESATITLDYNQYHPDGPTSSSTYGGYHPGIDYRAKYVPIYSPINGVVESGMGGKFGTLAIKKDGSDTRMIFLHMSKFHVEPGQRVQVGCNLGISGSTGANAPHLHIEARVNKTRAAWYFRSSGDTGVNKSPEEIPPEFVEVRQSKPCVP